MNKKNILIVDDDARIRELLRLYLEKAGFAVSEAENGVAALLLFQQSRPDLIILDVMMPVLDGLETCRQVRKLGAIPIIFLTARSEGEDKLLGFEIGADDYVSKPFAPGEVVARVQAILRRISPNTNQTPLPEPEPTLSFGDLRISANSRTVKLGEKIIELTAKEFDLLHTLVTYPGRILTRENLLDKIWGLEAAKDTRTVDVHIQRLRNKLQCEQSRTWNIATVWGVGYRFEIIEKQANES